jgi:hypothetical protein
MPGDPATLSAQACSSSKRWLRLTCDGTQPGWRGAICHLQSAADSARALVVSAVRSWFAARACSPSCRFWAEKNCKAWFPRCATAYARSESFLFYHDPADQTIDGTGHERRKLRLFIGQGLQLVVLLLISGTLVICSPPIRLTLVVRHLAGCPICFVFGTISQPLFAKPGVLPLYHNAAGKPGARR